MTECPRKIDHENTLALNGCEKLYLDARTADVFFVFCDDDSGEKVKVPAHKGILSAISPVFDKLFFSGAEQDNSIPVTNATPEAFREFLQFFYLKTASLNIKNKDDIISLCEEYKLDECKNAFVQADSDLFKASLTLDNMCRGYEVAIMFDLDGVKEHCEEQIRENILEIFESSSFLNCKSNVLRHILQLNSLACDETAVFDACIAWAKAHCIEKGLNENFAQNLRVELGDLIFDIRFGEMAIDTFYARYQPYKDLFTADEFKEIIGMIASKSFQPTKFNRDPRVARPNPTDVFVCDRVDQFGSAFFQSYTIYHFDHTVFTSNRSLLLKKIECSEVFNETFQSTPARLRVVQFDDNYEHIFYLRQMSLSPDTAKVIEFPTPIQIKPNNKYAIICEIRQYQCYNLLLHKTKVEICEGTVITFHDYKRGAHEVSCKQVGIVTKLYFSHGE